MKLFIDGEGNCRLENDFVLQFKSNDKIEIIQSGGEKILVKLAKDGDFAIFYGGNEYRAKASNGNIVEIA